MQITNEDAGLRRHDLDEVLFAAVSLGLPIFFNVEWLIDKAERGEWSGIWW
ncbi:MAG: hypothetical protein AAGK79_16375 [Pseudomonadota bacterium]